jgi:hypothetical protein
MIWPLLNHALFIEAIGLILLALICTLCSTTVTNYSLNSAQPTTATIPSIFLTRMTPPSLFVRQRPPPAPNILQPQRGPLVAHWHKEVPLFNQQFGPLILKHSKGDQYYLWTVVTYCNMISARTRKGSNVIKKIEERLNNIKKNDKICKQQEEKEKQIKDEGISHRIREEAEKEKEEAITPQNLHDVLNGVDSNQTKTRAADYNQEECSPLKKCSGSSKSSTKRTRAPQVTPSKATTSDQPAPSSTKSTTFLDSFNYPFPCTVMKLATHSVGAALIKI